MIEANKSVVWTISTKMNGDNNSKLRGIWSQSQPMLEIAVKMRELQSMLELLPNTVGRQELVSDFANMIATKYGKILSISNEMALPIAKPVECFVDPATSVLPKTEETSAKNQPNQETSHVDLEGNVLGEKKIKSTVVKTRKVVPDELRCEARIWGEKCDGTERCSKTAKINGLCGTHARMATVCPKACTLNETGTKLIGLGHGRITDFQEGEPGMPPYKDKNNYLVIGWWGGEVAKHIKKAIAEGTCLTRETKECAKSRWSAHSYKLWLAKQHTD